MQGVGMLMLQPLEYHGTLLRWTYPQPPEAHMPSLGTRRDQCMKN